MYAFDADLGIDPVDDGTALLVSGPSLDGLDALAYRLLVPESGEGLVLLSMDDPVEDAVAGFEAAGCAFDDSRMAVVECGVADEDTTRGGNFRRVASPTDLTGLGIEFSSLYEELYRGGYERVRVGLLSLTPLLMYAEDVRTVYRFLHATTGRIRSAGGLGVFALDPDSHDDRTVQSVLSVFDGVVELRNDGRGEFRVRGFEDRSNDWRAVDLSSA